MERSRMIREEYTVFLCIILETTEFDIIKYHMFGIKKRSHNFQLHIYLLCMSEELGNMVPSFVYTLSTFCTPHAKSLQSCLTLCHPMNCSPPGSSVQGILQARILEQVAVLSSRESFQSRDQTRVSLCLLYWQACSSTTSATWESQGSTVINKLGYWFYYVVFFFRKLYLFKYKAVYAKEGWMRNKY